MPVNTIINRLPDDKAYIVKAVFRQACQLLDHTPRFRLFTLHGQAHLTELFRILILLLDGGVQLNERQLYLLCLAISTHDLGMVIGLSNMEIKDIAQGRGGIPDPVNFESFIRNVHHEIISIYFRSNLKFLTSLGVTPVDLGIVADIGECHRKVNLRERSGDVRTLGALLRVIDELDVGPRRAPADVLENNYHDMDEVSRWHWFKHNITEEWHAGHNVEYSRGKSYSEIIFEVAVRPTRESSIPYWEIQVARPIIKALQDDNAQEIILEAFGVKVHVNRSSTLSRPNLLGEFWEKIEEHALTHGRKVILVVDDEIKKIEDSFFPLMNDYHVKCIPYPKAAFQFLDSVKVDFVVVDLQMPSQDLWNSVETDDSRMTGLRFAEDVKIKFPETKICILTGTKHSLSEEDKAKADLFLRKPIDPFDLADRIRKIIS